MRDIYQFLSFLLHTSRAIRLSRSSLAIVLLAGLVSGLGGAGILIVINKALAASGAPGPFLAWAFLGLCLIVPASGFVSQFLVAKIGAQAVFDLRIQLCRRILAAPVRHLEEIGAHRLLANLSDDVGTITTALIDLPLIAMHAAILLGCLIYLGWLSGSILLLVLGCLVLGTAAYKLPVGRAMRYFRRMRDELDAMFGHFRGLTQGIKELKMHRLRREAFVTEVLEPTGEAIRDQGIRGNAILAAGNNSGRLLFFAVIGLLLFILPRFRATPGEVMTGYVLILLYMRTPIEILLGRLPDLSRAAVAVQKVESLGLSLAREAREVEASLVFEGDRPGFERLDLCAVTHTYRREQEDGAFTLGPLDLCFRPGELHFLIGGNGSGKTTLAKLLVGLYTPEGGEIRLDGEPVTDENRDRYRQLFSVVFADFYLFENLLGLGGEALEARAGEYLSKLHLDRKVKVEGGALSTLDLSQGQRKRLALLTAYLEDRPIYLFDEWASDQDPLFKEIFYRQILPGLKARGKAVIVISHDDHYYGIADRVTKLDYGRIDNGSFSGDRT